MAKPQKPYLTEYGEGEKTLEITRSFSQKLNTGNYETRDFFMGAKATVLESEMEKVSEELYQICKREVEKSIREYCIELVQKRNVNATQEWNEKKQELYNTQSSLDDEAKKSTRPFFKKEY